jgi:hypothetical protein
MKRHHGSFNFESTNPAVGRNAAAKCSVADHIRFRTTDPSIPRERAVEEQADTLDAIRDAAKKGGTLISAKFEFDDAGKLFLSMYSAEKGLSVDPEENVPQEFSGNPEQSPWKKEVEVFKDVPHVARVAEQLTLLALSHRTLLDMIANAQKKQPGAVFSISPALKDHKPVAVVLIASNGKVTELSDDLQSGALL